VCACRKGTLLAPVDLCFSEPEEPEDPKDRGVIDLCADEAPVGLPSPPVSGPTSAGLAGHGEEEEELAAMAAQEGGCVALCRRVPRCEAALFVCCKWMMTGGGGETGKGRLQGLALFAHNVRRSTR
jgi:hypothetical protein